MNFSQYLNIHISVMVKVKKTDVSILKNMTNFSKNHGSSKSKTIGIIVRVFDKLFTIMLMSIFEKS